MAKGHPIVAAICDRLTPRGGQDWVGAQRGRLLRRATGDVLEIGAGTGVNLPHYRLARRVVLTEPDPAMLARLHHHLDEARVPVSVCGAAAEALPFPEASFDSVVATLVFCTVADLDAALAEVRRVLRPGGRLLFVEHIRAEGRRGRWQDRLQPAWSLVTAGCRPNRRTVEAIRAAGFEVLELDSLPLPLSFPLTVPVVEGLARR